ncbi:hypothetical protein H6G89_19965 [Oscillatoria sp. FACHB-1407]|uniref:hypothetical protein n=1 Tax=Oscillatoria sp. FACHB-1407 TaxID=2692847 RepID=UPI0016886FEB|nr:hypothetical protein [Oscillatoria sp. FACHB-1407]MBD2463316.1 hypothetical protein [Oscillatoria sp. FACHB-1407]
MNVRLLERSPPTQIPEKAGFDEPTQVGFALIAAVLTAEILIPNSRYLIPIPYYCDSQIGFGNKTRGVWGLCPQPGIPPLHPEFPPLFTTSCT